LSEGSTITARNPHRRHRWSTGVDLPGPDANPSKMEAKVITQYSYRGRHIGNSVPEEATQILAQIDEGPDDSVPAPAAVSESLAETIVLAQANATVEITEVSSVTNVTQSMVVDSSDVTIESTNKTTVEISSENVTEPENVVVAVAPSPAPIDTDNDEDALAALQHLARTRPHASLLIAQSIQAAVTEEQEHVSRLEEAIAKRDVALKQLTSENEKIQSQLKYVMELEQQRLMTASPSATPSASSSPAPSPSSSPTSSPTPSPQMEWVPVEHHHHHQPRPNKKACYHQCREAECAPLFENSLRQYAACMDECALKCYGSAT